MNTLISISLIGAGIFAAYALLRYRSLKGYWFKSPVIHRISVEPISPRGRTQQSISIYKLRGSRPVGLEVTLSSWFNIEQLHLTLSATEAVLLAEHLLEAERKCHITSHSSGPPHASLAAAP